MLILKHFQHHAEPTILSPSVRERAVTEGVIGDHLRSAAAPWSLLAGVRAMCPAEGADEAAAALGEASGVAAGEEPAEPTQMGSPPAAAATASHAPVMPEGGKTTELHNGSTITGADAEAAAPLANAPDTGCTQPSEVRGEAENPAHQASRHLRDSSAAPEQEQPQPADDARQRSAAAADAAGRAGGSAAGEAHPQLKADDLPADQLARPEHEQEVIDRAAHRRTTPFICQVSSLLLC